MLSDDDIYHLSDIFKSSDWLTMLGEGVWCFSPEIGWVDDR